MIQRTHSHMDGRFTRCQCGREPRHVVSIGRKLGEPGLVFQRVERHHLECPCGARTEMRDTLEEAEADWGTTYAQLRLPLRRKPRRRQVAA